MVLKDFECNICGVTEKLVDSNVREIVCCGKTAYSLMGAPAIIGEVRNHFNPHYDLQMGQYFGSLEQKKSWLKATNREQVSGQHSPRVSNKTSIICSKDQARKFDTVTDPSRTVNKSKKTK